MQYNFMNDYNELGHERILEAIGRANREQDGAYGLDTQSAHARALIQQRLEHADSAVHFLVGGTQTNLTIIVAALKPHQGVVSADTGHINVHESGAIEAAGHKVLTIPSGDGKITAADVERLAAAHYTDVNAEHMVQPGMVYLSNPTEVGTIYKKDELSAVYDVCKRYGMRLYVDGARLGCALAAQGNDVTFGDLARLTSAFSIGGTKMGALFGEALVVNAPALNEDLRYIVKQRGGLLAKGRLLGIQFETLFTDGLYEKIGRHAVVAGTAAGRRVSARAGTSCSCPRRRIRCFRPAETVARNAGGIVWVCVLAELRRGRTTSCGSAPPGRRRRNRSMRSLK